MDDWIDTYHAVRRLTLSGTYIFLTDSAVGQHEEENLRHLMANLGPDAHLPKIIPFLTCKHSLDYCLRYAERAYGHGLRTLVVLGGDRHDGVPRCVEHAYELRRKIRQRVPGMILGGWANPHANVDEQARFLADEAGETDFYLTQVVSHHSAENVARFLDAVRRKGVEMPGLFGVFYYRSARKNTLAILQQFFSVPAAELEAEFEKEKLGPDSICARSIGKLRELGIGNIYVSNLPIADAPARLRRIDDLTKKNGDRHQIPGEAQGKG